MCDEDMITYGAGKISKSSMCQWKREYPTMRIDWRSADHAIKEKDM